MSNGGGFTPGLNQPVSVVPISCDAMPFSLCLLPNPALKRDRPQAAGPLALRYHCYRYAERERKAREACAEILESVIDERIRLATQTDASTT
jgi:hypothetical protein